MKRFCAIKSGKRRAFSLIAVLVIALAGMALVGGILYTFNSFAGASRQVTSDSWEYNILQEAVEQGKTYVREEMIKHGNNGGDEPLTWKENDSAKVGAIDDLLIRSPAGGHSQTGHYIHRTVNERGLNGTLDLYIYAMGYTSSDVAPTLSPAERALLPPMMSPLPPNGGGGGSGGVLTATPLGTNSDEDEEPDEYKLDIAAYLIRAVFVDADTGAEKSIETAVIQSMRE
ncbi:MAG: hypothetical protein LBL73_00640 [Synergistaceae bacterium]|jgi:hypothetical protein|nr:hypothetical protein [Synergistaceae bacterium]